MDTFLMVCRVAAEFRTREGRSFCVTAKDLGTFINAPVWIRDTLLYKLLLKDGSITVAADRAEQKKLENDPMEGITAEGKAEEKKKPRSRKPEQA